jgi:hypothetical protein
MKKVIILCLLAISVSAQPKPFCKGIKADGTPCKSTIVMVDSYCRAHSPNSPKCGAITSKGTTCKWVVSKQGDKCKNHK